MILSEIIGNEKAKESLVNKIANNELANSYMFVGINGIGKRMIAKEFSRLVLCENFKEKNDCDSCIKFKSETHPDFKEIKPDGSSIKISQIRELGEFVYKKPILSNKKVVIIDDADSMTEEAQNSLLKTLEEPPKYMIIILIVSNESMLLNTIKSRCIKINFYGLSNEDMLKYIKMHNLIDKPTEEIIELCDGSIGKLYEVVEKLEIYEQAKNYIDYILNDDEKSLSDLLNKSEFVYKSKADINFILECFMTYIYTIMKKDEFKTNKYFNIIEIVKDTMTKIKSNANYDMSIDEMNFKIYEELGL